MNLSPVFIGLLLLGGSLNQTAYSQKYPSQKPDHDGTSLVLPARMGNTGTVSRTEADALLVYVIDEDFEGTFPPPGWTVINPDADRTWSRSAAASGYGQGDASARMNFYAYVPNEGQVDSLLSPIVTGLTISDSLSFDYAYCAYPYPVVGPDTVEVYLSTDGGASFAVPVTVLSYPDSTAPTNVNGWAPSADEWGTRRYAIPAGAVGTPVQLLFLSHNHYGQNFYIDNIRLGRQPVNDVAALSFNAPLNDGFVVETRAFTPAATFWNPGSADQLVPFTVHFRITDTSGSPVYTSSRFVAPLNSGSSVTVSFDPVSAGLPNGVYGMNAIADLGSDEYRGNDSLEGHCASILLVGTFPYGEDFEGPEDEGWSADAVSGSKNDWVRGTPAKPVQLTGAHSGVNAWVTVLDTTYSNGHNAALYSPFFDLGGISSNTVLGFYQNFRMESGWDAGVMEYSTNLGSTWLKMDTTLGQGPDFNTVKSRRWYNSNSLLGNLTPPKWSDTSTAYASHNSGWIRTTTSLGRLAGYPDVRFRWRFRTDGSQVEEGWAIDDVSVYEDTVRSVVVSLQRGWELVSNPVVTDHDSVLQVFPNSCSPIVYTFGVGGAQPSYRVENGIAYWGKFCYDAVCVLEGGAIDTDTIEVVEGWNMVGSVSLPVNVPTITSIPPGLQASQWFGFENGYVPVTTILPGKSYWIKSSGPGSFVLNGSWPAARP